MSRLRVMPIVEGHGEVESVRILIQRIWLEIVDGEHVEVLRPIRQSRQKLVQIDELQRAIELAIRKLAADESDSTPTLVLLLLDANGDLPCVLGPNLLEIANESHRHVDITCAVANIEYETWFVAAAESLANYLRLDPEQVVPEDPEGAGLRKAWIERRFKGSKYSETQDQPAMTAKMDLALCRRRSPSFDKFCRELEARSTSQRAQDSA